MLYITLYILADSVIWGDGCSTVTTAYICVLLKQVTMTKQCIGQGHHTQAVDLTNITSIRACTRMHVGVCMCVYSPDLSKNLLLYECTGRACGEVKTLRAHPVWDSPCPVVCALTPKHTLIHAGRYTPVHIHTLANHPICANSMLECIVNICRRQNRCTPVTHSSSCKHLRRLKNK